MSASYPTHDEFVRNIHSNKKIAIDYFKSYFPSSINRHLGFSTLAQQSDTYLSNELRKSLSDIVYNCKLKESKKDIMNTLDIYYIEKGRKEGFVKGRKEGREEGIEKGIEKTKEQIVQNLLPTNKFAISEIALLAGVNETFVKKVRSSINKGN